MKVLDCHDNQLKELDLSNNRKLDTLWCGTNQIAELDVSPCTVLESLSCESNQITRLHLANTVQESLKFLPCQDNKIPELDVTKCPSLEFIYCFMNQLKELDLSNNWKLEILWCGINQIAELDVSQNQSLQILECSSNQITELRIAQTANPYMRELYCQDNLISNLRLTSTTLYTLSCQNNRLLHLELNECPSLQKINISPQYPVQSVVTYDKNSSIALLMPEVEGGRVSLMKFRGTVIENNFLDARAELWNITSLRLPIYEGADYNLTDPASAQVEYVYSPAYAGGVSSDVANTKMQVYVRFKPFHALYINPAAYSGTYKAYVGTLYLDVPTVVPTDAGQKIWVATKITVGNEKAGTLTTSVKDVSILPANSGVIVSATTPRFHLFHGDAFVDNTKAEQSATSITYNTSPASYGGILKGTTDGVSVPYGQVLTLGRRRDDGSGTVGFWNYAGTKISPYRCYIDADDIPSLQTSSAARFVGLALLFDEDEDGTALQTGLDTAPIAPATDAAAAPAVYYDLQGRRVDQPRKGGVYIVGGKKVLMK